MCPWNSPSFLAELITMIMLTKREKSHPAEICAHSEVGKKDFYTRRNKKSSNAVI